MNRVFSSKTGGVVELFVFDRPFGWTFIYEDKAIPLEDLKYEAVKQLMDKYKETVPPDLFFALKDTVEKKRPQKKGCCRASDVANLMSEILEKVVIEGDALISDLDYCKVIKASGKWLVTPRPGQKLEVFTSAEQAAIYILKTWCE